MQEKDIYLGMSSWTDQIQFVITGREHTNLMLQAESIPPRYYYSNTKIIANNTNLGLEMGLLSFLKV